ncbi:MAG: magnesium transporter MgtE [Pelosinus sp.]|nr:magnesium transporter MgtE [Pelosinus sp.]
MADKTTKTAKQAPAKVPPKETVSEAPPKPKKKRFKLFFKITAILLLVLILGGVGFAAGVFFKIIDTENLGAQLKLSEYPVIGKYFTPKTNFDKIDEEMQNQTPQTEPVLPVAQTPNGQQMPGMGPNGQPLVSANGQVTDPAKVMDAAELQKQILLKQKEDAKRIGKLGRLYGGMKPEEAVPILNQLDDATVIAIFGKMEEDQVSKILAQMDAQRAARLTNTMAVGPAVVNPINDKQP